MGSPSPPPVAAAASADRSGADPRLPWIFLSHSGAQKRSFVCHLNVTLVHKGHRPFFDQDTVDSLPAGHNFAKKIFEACHACKMGVVVLSEQYVTSLWPMLELHNLLLPDHDSKERPIYPLFYELRPADLSDPGNLERWKACWAKKESYWQRRVTELASSSSNPISFNLDIDSWPQNLQKLKLRSGKLRSSYQNDYDYIKAVVFDICAELPPPRKFSLGVDVQGQRRIQKEIAEYFETQKQDDGVSVIGLHGIGGSGKSTACMLMANFYGDDFPGRCFYLEIPTEENGNMQLLEDIKFILRRLNSNSDVSNINEAMKNLKEGLRRYKCFIAIDNVWDNQRGDNFENAKRVVCMEYMRGSKILVTSRSKEVLERLVTSRRQLVAVQQTQSIWHVPSLLMEEAMATLEAYSCLSTCIPQDCLRKLADSCFFGGLCHPLCLKLNGSKLRRKGRGSFHKQQWGELVNSIVTTGLVISQHDDGENIVLQVVEKSLNGLPSQRLKIFIGLATCAFLENFCMPIWRALRFHLDFDITEDEMKSQVLELEYDGLLELVKDEKLRFQGDYFYGLILEEETCEHLLIHDLHRLVAKGKLGLYENINALSKCNLGGDLSNVSILEIAKQKHVNVSDVKESSLRSLFGGAKTPLLQGTLSHATIETQVLGLQGEFVTFHPTIKIKVLGLHNFRALRVLRLEYCWIEDEIVGWEWVPNLQWLELKVIEGLKRIWNACSHPTKLERLHLKDCYHLEEISEWGCSQNLRWLHLSGLRRLRRIESITCPSKLEHVLLRGCIYLKLHTLVGTTHDSSCLIKMGDGGRDLPKLRSLWISENKHLVVGPIHHACPNLELLRLEIMPIRKGFRTILEFLRSYWLAPSHAISNLACLRVLILRGLQSLENLSYVSYLTELEQLRLQDLPDLEEIGVLGARHTNLSIIDIRDCPKLLEAGFPWLDAPPSLKNLYLELVTSIEWELVSESWGVLELKGLDDDELPLYEEFLQPLTLHSCISTLMGHLGASTLGLPSLQEIKFTACSNLMDVFGLVSTPSLRVARFIRCSNLMSDFDLAGHPSLQEIDFFDCKNLTANISSVVNMPSLQVAKFRACHELTGVPTLAGNPSLQEIEFESCENLMDISGLVEIPSLRVANFFYCSKLTGFSNQASHPSLQEIEFYSCRNLTDISGLVNIPTLRVAKFGACSKLTGVSALASHPSLQEIKFESCENLMDISGLVKIPSLRVVEFSDCSKLMGVVDVFDKLVECGRDIQVWVDGQRRDEASPHIKQRISNE